MADLKAVTLKNVELKWPFLAEPQTRGEFASNKYQVDVVISKEDAKIVNELKNSRQQLKEVDGKYVITLKSSKQPSVVDTRKIPLTDDEMKSIGNGTIAHVKATQYKGFKEQIFLGLRAVMVTELHKYAGNDDFADIEVETDDSSAPFTTEDDDLI